MSPFSTGSKPPPEPAQAWGLAAANLFLWPGLGTALARRKSGLVQMGVSGGGVVMAMAGLVGFYTRWVTTTEFPGWRDKYILLFGAGMFCFMAAWLWALASSVQLIRSARIQPKPQPLTHPMPPRWPEMK